MNNVFLDENDFKREVNTLSRQITQDIFNKINFQSLEKPNTIQEHDNFKRHLINGSIYYDLNKSCFKGKFTQADKQYLYSINAIWKKELGGYYITIFNLKTDLQNLIISISEGRKIFFNKLQTTQQQLNQYTLNNNIKNIINHILQLIVLKLAKQYFLNKNKIKINQVVFATTLTSLIQDVIYRKINVILTYENINNKPAWLLQERLTMSLSVGIFDVVGFAIRQTLFDSQKDIAKTHLKTTKFKWIHRTPQPQDRKVHIHWWKSNRTFDLLDLPINPEIMERDYPGKLIHCHCKIKLI